MSELLNRIAQAKNKLTSVKTKVTLETGCQIYEERNDKGEFTCKKVEDEEDETGDGVSFQASDLYKIIQYLAISNRRKKLVERRLRYGFVCDLNPDLQLANVANGIYIGSQDIAAELATLKLNGITHIINAATGVENHFPKHFKYLKLPVYDEPRHRIDAHFEQSNDFISNAIDCGGKVLVHCNAGISRSSTIVLAYIMLTERKTLPAALEQVRAVRAVARPNDGFMDQLREYSKNLRSIESVKSNSIGKLYEQCNFS